MILSFHPIIEADLNIIVAGRPPGETELCAIRQAQAVIVSQGCPEALYRMARRNCTHVFPNLDMRFDYPGKCGQIELFSRLGIAHPRTRCYPCLDEFRRDRSAAFELPAVVKMSWGGQGETVFKVSHGQELELALRRVADFELSGQRGFLIQQYIPGAQHALRVVVIGSRTLSYWRLQKDSGRFGTSVDGGAAIDHQADPDLQAAGRTAAREFCERTGLQLAGFDFIFSQRDTDADPMEPLMLEINYYFGRTGLGGSEAYYRILVEEVDAWLAGLGLKRRENLSPGQGV